ncbi:DNA repair protein RecO [Pseudogemmobacter sonorensis]|uniref:DNA repair protein RecO n=1 Tax=Pseudogemmobacter sonorensis TaxID=2989681 RepID=UPI0036CCB90E
MTEWRDEGVILTVRPHGESAAIVDLFTLGHGRHAGVVRGGTGRRLAPVLQPGAQLRVAWRARLETHIGTYAVDPVKSRAHLLDDRLGLAGLGAICALLHVALPERAPHPALWSATQDLLDRLGAPGWTEVYLRWEMQLLAELGYGLDLSACAATGAREGLAFVSPKTGRAVSRAGAGDWADRLLPLPEGMAAPGFVEGNFADSDFAGGRDGTRISPAGILQGLAITGHFLNRELAEGAWRRPLPEARGRLLDLLARDV